MLRGERGFTAARAAGPRDLESFPSDFPGFLGKTQ
jgi:hypothetical protein